MMHTCKWHTWSLNHPVFMSYLSDEEARDRAVRCYIYCAVQRLCGVPMETVWAGTCTEAQARASQEEHPSQCHYPACFA